MYQFGWTGLEFQRRLAVDVSVWTVGIGISSLRCVDSDLDWRSLCYFGRSGFKFRIRLVLYVAVVVTEIEILSDHIKQFLDDTTTPSIYKKKQNTFRPHRQVPGHHTTLPVTSRM